MSTQLAGNSKLHIIVLSILFFISGGAGLIYQVAWQRVLYTAFGSDIESVSIIVAAFMSGLGLGALTGGKLADLLPKHTLPLFCLCELGIGCYGFLSYLLMKTAGDVFISFSLFVIAAVNFLLVIIPALLMGATLPILITYTVKRWDNVGRATGHLYAINTLGATIGAFITGFILFNYFTLHEVIYFAALLNIFVAITTYLYFRNI